MSSTSG